MIQPGENISLKPFNTFGIDIMARWFAPFGTQDELSALLDFQRTMASPGKGSRAHPLILGGGSNLLFRGNFDGLVLKNEIKGIELIREDEKYVYVRVGAGESWHGFVQYCLQRNWAGVENLSLIPGSVGAAPMQNIGAYGVEIKEVFYELEAWDLHESKIYTFTLNDCEFGYRESVFKRRLRDRAIILNVTLRLNKVPKFHTEYGAIREELDKMGVQQLSIQAISQAVIRIRSSKLPDPKQIGNAGSFFKNPTVSGDRFAALKAAFPGIPGYPSTLPPLQPSESAAATSSQSLQAPPPSSGSTPPSSQSPPPAPVKLAAGWLIEQCGWKGYRRGDAGCHALQALVLVNYGQASGEEIYDLSEEILLSVKKKFGVELEREVNII
ncbi:MAG TPA: UDP-N-acetylmuramate dehydrogenase [Puia sp.]|nr:UDP-N-acetylmuramate dehydrogenase [Puia sp.]